jgi:hypothetical protein
MAAHALHPPLQGEGRSVRVNELIGVRWPGLAPAAAARRINRLVVD